jgi:hypothetical protein
LAIQNLLNTKWKETQIEPEAGFKMNWHQFQKFTLRPARHSLEDFASRFFSNLKLVIDTE